MGSRPVTPELPPGFEIESTGGLPPGFEIESVPEEKKELSFLERLKRGAVSLTAEIGPEIVGGTAGFIAGGPVGALIGAASAEALDQLLRRILVSRGLALPPPETSTQAAGQIAGAVVGEATAQFGRAGQIAIAGPAATSAAAREVLRVPSQVAAAKEFGVQLTRGQASQGIFTTAFERLLRGAFGSAQVLKKLDFKVAQQLRRAGQQIADDISKRPLSRLEIGEFVQNTLNRRRALAQAAFGKAEENILKNAGNVRVELRPFFKQEVNKLVAQFDPGITAVPGVGQAGGVGKVAKILKDFSALDELSIAEARALQKNLRALTRDRELSAASGSLKVLERRLTEQIRGALRRAGKFQELRNFETASTNLAKTIDLLDRSAIKRLSDLDRPELVAEYLLQKGSQTRVTELRSAIGSQNMRKVERALWEQTLLKAQSEGVLPGDAIERVLGKQLGEDVLEAIWGQRPEILAKIQRFANLANIVSLRPGITKPLSAGDLPTGMFAQLGAASTGIIFVLSGDPQTGALFLGGALLGPAVIAKLLTRKDGADLLIRAARTPMGSQAGRLLLARIEAQRKAKESFKEIIESQKIPSTIP